MEVETECFDTFNFLDSLKQTVANKNKLTFVSNTLSKSSGGKSICFIENSIKEN